MSIVLMTREGITFQRISESNLSLSRCRALAQSHSDIISKPVYYLNENPMSTA